MQCMKVVMDADCLIKLTKSKLKELVCDNFSVVIPHTVKKEVIGNATKYPDASIIRDNLERNLLTVSKELPSSGKGEDEALMIYNHGKFHAICSDDKRFIKRLRFLNIPYITPSVFITILLKIGKLTIKEANEKIDSLSPFISDDEYNTIKIILGNWRGA